MRGYWAAFGLGFGLYAGASVGLAQGGGETYQNPPPRPPMQVMSRVAIPPDDSDPPSVTADNDDDDGAPRDGSDGAPCQGSACPPTEAQAAQYLLTSGPNTSSVYAAPFESLDNKFAVVGFVRQNWPVSVEYIAEPNTVTVLKVKLYHHRRIWKFQFPFHEVAFQQNLDALPAEVETDNPWHRTVKVEAITLSPAADPKAADPNPHVGRIEVVSYRLDGDQIMRRNGKAVRAPVEIVGMAMGPRAVGSLTLRSGVLDDTEVRIPAKKAPVPSLGYSYITDNRRYDLLRVGLEKYQDRYLRWDYDREVAEPHAGGAQTTYRGAWPVSSKRRPGTYRMAISAWYTCGGVTISERLAECGDNPAWSVLRTGKFRLVQ